MAGAALARESIAEVWKELDLLAVSHFAEVDGGVEPRRPYAPDWGLMKDMERLGIFCLYTARINGKLVGYITWQKSVDVESKGLLVGFQGAWFVAPKHPLTAWKLFIWSMNDLKAQGVKILFVHHRMQGRGAGLGKFFSRMGAKLIQHNYSLWIGE